mmetsp:Transcript_424/g.689  ORF Transcript_424/g.689 Transcript_424/m.689 type:complete len:80 (+) Transcript_424:478-717(+)
MLVGQRLTTLVGALGDETANDFLAEPHYRVDVLSVPIMDDTAIFSGPLPDTSPQCNNYLATQQNNAFQLNLKRIVEFEK